MNKISYRTVCFASLLHGIGEFFTRDLTISADKSFYIYELLNDENCRKLSKFLDADLLKDILFHYSVPGYNMQNSVSKKCIRIIDIAGRLSNKDANEDIKSNAEHEYLNCIFSRLDIGNGLPRASAYRHVPLEPDAIFPFDPNSGDTRKSDDETILQREFCTYWNKALAEAKTVEMLYQMLLRILERYTWCIPLDGQSEIADISLYDHLRLTSAIAACLCKKHSEDPQFDERLMEDDSHDSFILAEGDFSGIQKYIFGGISEKQGGMAKKLRARSFVIASLVNLAARALIDRCDVPASCILMNSGGNFFILLPNTESVKTKLTDFQYEIDKKLFDTFQGGVALHIAYTCMCGNDFGSFGDKIRETKEQLAIRKRQPYASLLHNDGRWTEAQPFSTDAYEKKLGICKGCGNEFAEFETEDGPIGRRCKQETEIGRHLVKTKVITLIRSDMGLLSLGDWSVLPYGAEGEIYALKSDDSDYLLAPLWRQANHVPANSKRILTFEEISDKSEGVNWLGYLKADVDRLGMLFTVGFRKETGENFGNIARIASLSRMMEIFFSEWLDRFVERKFPECYIVFSGGDDLFIIGPWNQIISLAIQIRRSFSDFTGGNPNTTLSCGISFSPVRLPVAYAARSAERALDRAKEEHSFLHPTGRDQVCMFDHVMKWKYVHKVMKAADNVVGWVRDGKLTTGDVRRMRKYAEMFEQYTASGGQDTKGLRYAGHLSYDIGRKMSENRKRLDIQVKKFMESLRDISQEGLIHHLGVVCDFALLMNRKKGE